ncbi:MAG TPA: DoxX family protein [Dermatophilaceae bacterium]|nr:DoxX family protein [Dermatophilaceae bacterium]
MTTTDALQNVWRSLRSVWRPRAATAQVVSASPSRALARRLDDKVTDALRPLVMPVLRIALGMVFVWFGLLKVINASPVGGLVAGTLPWAPAGFIVPTLGSVEVLLGLGLVTGIMLRLVLPALVAHLAGTFLTFAMLPGLMFHHHNPLLLTENGEFVMKNAVLISAALVLVVHSRAASRAPDPAPPAISR